MSQPIPVSISTTLGDALHDLRSALDCAACEIARRYVDGDLSNAEERAVQAPVALGDAAIRERRDPRLRWPVLQLDRLLLLARLLVQFR
jgi:hypothetical protein